MSDAGVCSRFRNGAFPTSIPGVSNGSKFHAIEIDPDIPQNWQVRPSSGKNVLIVGRGGGKQMVSLELTPFLKKCRAIELKAARDPADRQLTATDGRRRI